MRPDHLPPQGSNGVNETCRCDQVSYTRILFAFSSPPAKVTANIFVLVSLFVLVFRTLAMLLKGVLRTSVHVDIITLSYVFTEELSDSKKGL